VRAPDATRATAPRGATASEGRSVDPGAVAPRAGSKHNSGPRRSGECSTIGVLDGSLLHMLGRIVSSELGPDVNLGGLAYGAGNVGLRQLWLTPSALAAIGLPAELGRLFGSNAGHPFLEAPGRAVPAAQTALAPRLSCWGGGLPPFELLVPAWDRGSPWRALTYAPALLAELVDFTDATGMLWKGSGAITSDAWLRTYYGRRLSLMEWPPPALEGGLEPDLHFYRAPEGPELRASHLMAFDVRGMYLSAASSLALPAGQYSQGFTSNLGGPFPGYWRVPDGAGGWHYVTTPTAEAALVNYLTTAGYYWPESHRYLEPWYRTLRDGRARLMASGAGVALEALKAVYRQGIGRFGSTARTRPDDPLFLPYWRHAVQAEARTRLERRIAALTQRPAAVDVDCLYFLTSARSPERFAARVGLTLGDGLGRFRFVGLAPGREGRSALAEPSAHAALVALRGLVEGGPR